MIAVLCLVLVLVAFNLAVSAVSLACSAGLIDIKKPKAKPIIQPIQMDSPHNPPVQTKQAEKVEPPRRITPMEISSLATQAKKKQHEALKTVSS